MSDPFMDEVNDRLNAAIERVRKRDSDRKADRNRRVRQANQRQAEVVDADGRTHIVTVRFASETRRPVIEGEQLGEQLGFPIDLGTFQKPDPSRDVTPVTRRHTCHTPSQMSGRED